MHVCGFIGDKGGLCVKMAKILIINDSREICNFLKLVFEDHGHVVACFLSPENALEKIAEMLPDIIFMDINLPIMSGIELTSVLRKDTRTKDIYVIVCSATNYNHSDIEMALRAGGNDFLSIPCVPIVALTRINIALVNIQLLKENRRIKRQFKVQKDFLQDLLDHTPDIIYFKDIKGRLIMVNKAHSKGHGKASEEIIGKTDFDLFPLKEAQKMTVDDLYVMETKKPIQDRIEFTTRPSGQKLFVSTTKIPRFNEKDQVIGIMGITRDITARIMAQKSAVKERELVKKIINASSTPIFVVDNNHKVIYWNKACEKLTGIRKYDMIGTDNYWKLFYEEKRPCLLDFIIDNKEDQLDKYYEKSDTIDCLPGSICVERWVDNINGKKMYLRGTANALLNQKDEIIGAVQTIEDLTKHKQMQESLKESQKQLSELALKDPLTGLYNYRYLVDRMASELKRAQRNALSLSVVMLDIDYFKAINDAYGHTFGDQALEQFSLFIKNMCRENDIAARFGGEEFVLVLPDTDKNGLKEFISRFETAINTHEFKIPPHTIKISISIGAVNYPDILISGETELLKMLDDAMRKAKSKGGNCVEIYDIESSSDILITEKNRNIKDLKDKVISLEKRMERTVVEFLFAFARSLEGEKYYPPNHTETMVKLVEKIAKKLNMERRSIDHLKHASVLYDIGKICIDESILMKRTRLNKSEYEKIKMHPRISAEVIQTIDMFKEAVPAVLYHHERYDGTGYGTGLDGKQIPLGARILAVADSFQALQTEKPYRKAYSRREAIKIIEKESGKHFDPDVVCALKELEN